MIHWYDALIIAGATMVIDWAIFAYVGHRVATRLTTVAEQAVLKGADEVKTSLFKMIPSLIPLVMAAIREPSSSDAA